MFIEYTHKRRYGESPSKNTITIIFSAVVSIYCIGGMLGGFLTAYIAQRCGSRGGLLINNIFIFAGAVLMGFCEMAGSYEMLLIGRFIVGINSGKILEFPFLVKPTILHQCEKTKTTHNYFNRLH